MFYSRLSDLLGCPSGGSTTVLLLDDCNEAGQADQCYVPISVPDYQDYQKKTNSVFTARSILSIKTREKREALANCPCLAMWPAAVFITNAAVGPYLNLNCRLRVQLLVTP